MKITNALKPKEVILFVVCKTNCSIKVLKAFIGVCSIREVCL